MKRMMALVLLLALSGCGDCKPGSPTSAKLEDKGRFKYEYQGGSCWLVTDKKTGEEYLAITNCGISKLGTVAPLEK